MSAACFIASSAWGRSVLLWDQGVSLKLVKGGFLDPASPGFYTASQGSEWLKPIGPLLRQVWVNQEPAAGTSVYVNRSTQTAMGEFRTAKARGEVKWHLGAKAVFLTITAVGSEPIEIRAEGALPLKFTEVPGTSARQWVLKAAIPRPDRSDVSGQLEPQRDESVLTESISEATRSDPGSWIELDGPFFDQVAIASLSQIIGRSLQNGARPMAGPFSTTNSRYSGCTFWDADLWMMPSVSLFQPASAARFADMRLSQVNEARKLADAYQKAGFPKLVTESRRRTRFGGPPNAAGASLSSMIRFPWEADGFGREAGGTESVLQEHISGSVWLGLNFAAQLGLAEISRVEKVRQGVSAWYLARSQPTQEGRSLKGVMSPDESAIADDDLFTNLLAQTLTGEDFVLPRDSESLLNYQKDKVSGYKQHAGLLSLFPLQNPKAERESEAMLKRFSGLTAPDGPAMSVSLEALLWARQGGSKKAYKLWLESWQKYGRTGVFTERPKGGEDVFVTGAAGCLNAVLYGFAGIRLDSAPLAGAPWTKKLKSGAWLSIKPNLPQEWKKLTLNNVHLNGETFKIRISGDQVLVSKP